MRMLTRTAAADEALPHTPPGRRVSPDPTILRRGSIRHVAPDRSTTCCRLSLRRRYWGGSQTTVREGASHGVMGASALSVSLWLLIGAWAAGQESGEQRRWCWGFEEADGLAVHEATGRAAPGAILNESRGVARVPGRTGMGLEFSGGARTQRGNAGCVQLKGLEEVDWSNGMTVEAWVFFTELERPATYEIVSNTKDDRGPGWRLMVSWQSLWLRTGEGGGGVTWGGGSNPSVTRFATGQWYHLAGTHDGSVFRVYVDGVLVGQSAAGLTLPPGEPIVNVGSYRGGYAYGVNGVVDDVRLYNYARSSVEIIVTAKLGGE